MFFQEVIVLTALFFIPLAFKTNMSTTLHEFKYMNRVMHSCTALLLKSMWVSVCLSPLDPPTWWPRKSRPGNGFLITAQIISHVSYMVAAGSELFMFYISSVQWLFFLDWVRFCYCFFLYNRGSWHCNYFKKIFVLIPNAVTVYYMFTCFNFTLCQVKARFSCSIIVINILLVDFKYFNYMEKQLSSLII